MEVPQQAKPALLAFDQKRLVQTLGFALSPLSVLLDEGLQDAFRIIERDRPDGLVVFSDPLTHAQEALIVGFAANARMVALFADRGFVDVLDQGTNERFRAQIDLTPDGFVFTANAFEGAGSTAYDFHCK